MEKNVKEKALLLTTSQAISILGVGRGRFKEWREMFDIVDVSDTTQPLWRRSDVEEIPNKLEALARSKTSQTAA